ncbi:GlxA family transcriptional regulator [Tsuneonella sp. CC-YZS046]|uniref:GlxA family transcriptional regulator n=1 Tax=Tsuneonella sp. CC-YZS046 TaxID=3042152 RepID=UPI002D77E5E6|nr:GlxA family transcriptional regulator [Tsuneonella sp. CC-YZS046]WRO65568.1 GlxA family transcriptional regulator [Tsuneonella sp. CC-YZS046]
MPESDLSPSPRSIALLLVEGFPMLAYASIVEPFRAANILAGRTLYRWMHVAIPEVRDTDALQPARASNGAAILAEARIEDAAACDMAFVIAGGDPAAFADRATFAALRRLAAAQLLLGGVSGGPFLLARAGLLSGHRCTVHWEHAPAMREAFPDLMLEEALYVIDRRRMTCAGGTAALDMALELIEREQGPALAMKVGEWFIRTEAREAGLAQRPSLKDRFRTTDERVLRALAAMERAVEVPVSRASLAALCGVTLRQLERLFAKRLGSTIADTYMAIRLDHAAQLLRATSLPVTEIALSCGFSGSSHFSRAFKRRFGSPPGKARLKAPETH